MVMGVIVCVHVCVRVCAYMTKHYLTPEHQYD